MPIIYPARSTIIHRARQQFACSIQKCASLSKRNGEHGFENLCPPYLVIMGPNRLLGEVLHVDRRERYHAPSKLEVPARAAGPATARPAVFG